MGIGGCKWAHLSVGHDKDSGRIDDSVDSVGDDEHGGVLEVRADGFLKGAHQAQQCTSTWHSEDVD